MSSEVLIAGRKLKLTNLDKLFWPNDGYTKLDLIKYYTQIAPYIIPHLINRPLVFTRYPNGIEGKSFYQKNAPNHLPEWIPTYPWYSEDSKRTINFILVDETATLLWLANQACLEIHPWLSNINSIDYPDFLVMDLDPSPGSTYEEVKQIALVTKELLDKLNLNSYLKTSGSEGLHIFVPVINEYTYEEIRSLGQQLASIICNVLPDIATIERSVSKRGRKVYIDYMQNVQGKTLSSVYSVRPRPGAPVSTPLMWEEIHNYTPKDFNIKNILSRIETHGDLFHNVLTDKQSLAEANKKLGI